MHLSSWPVAEFEGLQPILERLNSLCPTPDVQTHLLHLASYGEIFPHIDNVDASGSWILGVSLGAERILCMRKADNQNETQCLTLQSGSVYLQQSEASFCLLMPLSPDTCYFRDYSRYNYLHSIERNQCVGQRMSIVIRVGVSSHRIRQRINSMFRIVVPFPYRSDRLIYRCHIVSAHETTCTNALPVGLLVQPPFSRCGLLQRFGLLVSPGFAADRLEGHDLQASRIVSNPAKIVTKANFRPKVGCFCVLYM